MLNTVQGAVLKKPAVAGGADSILLETGDKLLLETSLPVELNTGIPAQSAASALDGTEWTVIVQSGNTVKIATVDLMRFLHG